MRNSSNRVMFAFAATVLAVAVLTFAWNVAGLSVNVGLSQRIAVARKTWASKSGGSYRAIVRVIDYNRPAAGDVTVVVADGKLAEVSSTSVIPQDQPPADDTIEALFDYAAAQVAEVPYVYISTGSGYHYTLRINADLGYIEEFKIDICGRGPLTDDSLECRWGFEVLDVRLGG